MIGMIILRENSSVASHGSYFLLVEKTKRRVHLLCGKEAETVHQRIQMDEESNIDLESTIGFKKNH